ncbi:alpha-D-ribose 1-methylphosphonate 5-triphosphate diphosphatase [Bacillus sp. JCM 19034]|uniref:alpha-D-ribose 1-methylphosphonate 5-triphosphate diphosphatase n=1 Tax=Bacillus sp. JCM 19034 TaxID=1481928 RepID=UPI0007824B4F|nr:alpha-D-ribose 1-methylphosphonate 5-triphosphate diphosphatase [Bacillus sp. JCM 19034]
MNTIRIFNGNIVTPNEILVGGTITIKNGSIVNIQSGSVNDPQPFDIDATNKWVLPGLIDSHSDAIEQEVEPRPTSIMPLPFAFTQLERQLIGHGITTMYHSLSMYYSLAEGNWIRQNENLEKVIEFIHDYRKEATLLRHKVHLRYEMRNKKGLRTVEKLLVNNMIDQLSFMDHTPGKGAWMNIDVQREKIMKRLNYTKEQANQHMKELKGNDSFQMEEFEWLAELAFEKGVPVASHDDSSIETLDIMGKWKGRISEFPINLPIAKAAKSRQLSVVMGAPNLLLGRSHNDNLSTLHAIEEGVVDMLCSDYYPSSLLQGLFLLKNKGFDFVEIVKLATLNPAKALQIDKYLGSIEQNKLADLLIISEKDGLPILEKVFVDGRLNYQVN